MSIMLRNDSEGCKLKTSVVMTGRGGSQLNIRDVTLHKASMGLCNRHAWPGSACCRCRSSPAWRPGITLAFSRAHTETQTSESRISSAVSKSMISVRAERLLSMYEERVRPGGGSRRCHVTQLTFSLPGEMFHGESKDGRTRSTEVAANVGHKFTSLV
ncbi:hypothetical protein J6590_010665 [Homalodisca vitripennis]|nr:hypothetical protein J6590_010665 [Homalodisca vitripennis]